MADKITSEQRSEIMRTIKAQSHLENTVAKELYRRGIRYRRNNKKLMGNPDISIQKYKVVIFIDSCFWHCCPIHGNIPKSNIEYWVRKLDRNAKRDIEVNKYYVDNGWYILRVWEHDLQNNFESTIERIIAFVKEAKISLISRKL
ncbi:very short patch repair endonuclease [Trichococcus sp. K1Tr]|uniref:very short patch repair endonuclease n=1 Tax=Trichococcus sp. K1Tr TaxID=3020847 RepID=UPI00232D4252|nr:very short patch repair endonuclease [Trichococcus sp. K1Tr]MDB6352159.1 very short patch repair endonuclease [Trichococcus sp. K1Tr]